MMKYLTIAIILTILTAGAVMTAVSAEEYTMPGMRGMHMMHGYGTGKSSLTNDQSKQISKLKLEHKKKIYPLKTKLQQTRFELALLMMDNNPNQKSIDKKIAQIVKLKSEKIRLKVRHKIDVRKVLSDEQRVHFDLKLLKKSSFNKSRMHHGYR